MNACHRGILALLACTIGFAASGWAQQAVRLPTVGILSDGGPTTCGSDAPGFPVACMMDGLRALGYVEGRNVAFEYRYARGDLKRLPALAAELVALRPDVVYTLTSAGADAAASATSTIPIVVGLAAEPTLVRLAGNLARPVGNVTGYTTGSFGHETLEKCLQLLKELAPRTTRVALILNPDNKSLPSLGVLDPAAARLGIALVRIDARSASELPQAFAALLSSGANAIYIGNETTLGGSPEARKQISAWALSHRLPNASTSTLYAADGGLVSLGTDFAATSRRSASYVDRILRGAKPNDLPVERPTLFKLSVNRKTATALGLTIPQGLLLRADEVIE